MEIIKFNKDELSQTLQPILSVVERRNALPILLNVLMTFRENKVSFTTSDIEIQMTSTLIKEDYEFKDDITVFASGKDGIFSAGTPIGKTKYTGEVELFVDPNQLSFVTVNLIKPSKEVF